MDLGKHVYVQKPLTWSVAEARQLSRKAREHEARDADGQPGALVGRCADRGRVHLGGRDRRRPRGSRVDEPSARLLAAGHPASETPPCRPIRSRCRWNGPGSSARLANAMAGDYPVPPKGSPGTSSSAWRPSVAYHPVYHPFNWRGWVDWGCGAIGDMGAHLIDHSDVGARSRISRRPSKRWRHRSTAPSFPNATMTVYEFPARGGTAAGEADVVRRRPETAQARWSSGRDRS